MKTIEIKIEGITQGVGFRPFIYNLANKLNLKGFILNDSNGVLIEIEGDEIEQFINQIELQKPSLAVIDSIEIKEIQNRNFKNFEIRESRDLGKLKTIIPIDSAICPKCKIELFDKSNKRYNYPFITCTECGVRFTIIKSMPYDRANTSMAKFEMCQFCKGEYINPNSRRFHTEPVSCPDCSPKLSLLDENLLELEIGNLAIERVIKELKDGKIVAIKGYGGFHLVCDGLNFDSISRLREIKKRKKKPFALMFRDLESIKQVAKVNRLEEKLLTSNIAPIVLLDSFDSDLPSNIAPELNKLGVFLPYSAIHLLIFKEFKNPLVVTSANITKEPLIIDSNEFKRIKLADFILDCNRDIINRCDDSVVMALDEEYKITIRRARGLAPKNIKLPFKLDKNILSTGANQKSVFAIAFEDNAILSPHIGDLESIKSIESFEEMIERISKMYSFKPDLIICDKHINYESSKWAERQNIPLKRIQHHYSHIRAVLYEKKINFDVLAVAFDGSGFGDDGKIWGGEFFIANQKSYQRIKHLREFKLLGGEVAIKNPKRIALSILFDIFDSKALDLNLSTIKAFNQTELKNLYQIHKKAINSPLTSSIGRLFDAIASLIDITQEINYEGESGAIMESFYDENLNEAYEFEIRDEIIDFENLILAILGDLDKRIVVTKFINAIINLILTIQKEIKLPIVFCGGVFQNRALSSNLIKRLKIENIAFYIPEEIPINDGGIAFGQIER